MIFDVFAMLNGIWGGVCALVLIPALIDKKYRRFVTVIAVIFIVNSLFLCFSERIPALESILRSVAVALINVVIVYLVVHFFHHKRSVLDLFRSCNRR